MIEGTVVLSGVGTPQGFSAYMDAFRAELTRKLDAVALSVREAIKTHGMSQSGSQTVGVVTGSLRASLLAQVLAPTVPDSWGIVQTYIDPAAVNSASGVPTSVYGEALQARKGFLEYGYEAGSASVSAATEAALQQAVAVADASTGGA